MTFQQSHRRRGPTAEKPLHGGRRTGFVPTAVSAPLIVLVLAAFMVMFVL